MTELRRICKPNSPMIFTASQPFTSMLVMSNLKEFKVEWIWEKNRGSNFATAKYLPMKEHESVLVFSNGGGKHRITQLNKNEQRVVKQGRSMTLTLVILASVIP